jgi:hypothetical protein
MESYGKIYQFVHSINRNLPSLSCFYIPHKSSFSLTRLCSAIWQIIQILTDGIFMSPTRLNSPIRLQLIWFFSIGETNLI